MKKDIEKKFGELTDYTEGEIGYTFDSVEKMMDEYAKSLSIGFANWLAEYYITLADVPNLWIEASLNADDTEYTTEQLFSLYMDSLK